MLYCTIHIYVLHNTTHCTKYYLLYDNVTLYTILQYTTRNILYCTALYQYVYYTILRTLTTLHDAHYNYTILYLYYTTLCPILYYTINSILYYTILYAMLYTILHSSTCTVYIYIYVCIYIHTTLIQRSNWCFTVCYIHLWLEDVTELVQSVRRTCSAYLLFVPF